MFKKCSKCNIFKDLLEFHKDQSHRDGLKSYCKKCAIEYNQIRAQQNKGKFIKHSKQCCICKLIRNWTDFFKNSLTNDGLSSQCKFCHKELAKEFSLSISAISAIILRKTWKHVK